MPRPSPPRHPAEVAVVAAVAAAGEDRGDARPGRGRRPSREGARPVIPTLIVVAVLVILALLVVTGFNKLRRADIGAQEALGGIDVQLTRRAELRSEERRVGKERRARRGPEHTNRKT